MAPPPQEFCVVDGCFEIAGRWARSRKHCRPHYESEILANVELVRCEVIGGTGRRGEEVRVTDARTQRSVGRGGVVELDPEETKILAVVAAGAVKILPGAAATTLKASTKKG